MVAEWVKGIEELAKVARKYPQSAYVGLTQCLQAQWQYVCRVDPAVGPLLQPVEDALLKSFIPALFDFPQNQVITPDFRELLGNAVKQGGLAIRNPTVGAERHHQQSVESVELLVESLVSNGALDNDGHASTVRAAGSKARAERCKAEHARLKELAEGKPKVMRRVERMGKSGAWLNAIPDRLSGTELSFQEFHDSLYLRYGVPLPDLPKKCDGCGEKMTVQHGLSCKTGGLVVARHNDVRDEWAHLCSLALGGSAVGTEPLIFYGTAAVPEGAATADDADEAAQGSTGEGGTSRSAGDEARGDVRARGFWKKRRDCVFDVRLADTDAKSYSKVSPLKLLERFAREKKSKYEEACRERRRDFTPLVYSVDGVPCEEAKAAERRLAGLLAQKWERNYSEMCGYVRTRLCLSVVRSNTLLLRGERANTWRRRGAGDGVAAGSTPMARHG